MKLLLSDHTELYYHVSGHGEPLLLLHGNMQDSTAFAEQVAVLSQQYEIIQMDSRGHGKSDHGQTPLSLALMAEDVCKLIKHLSLKSLTLIGFSDGANIALKVAIDRPTCIKQLILISPNIKPSALRLWIKLPLKLISYLTWPLSVSEPIRKYRELLSLMLDEQHFDWKMLETLHMPVLLMASQFDLIQWQHLNQIGDTLPQAETFFLPGAGHMRLKSSASLINEVILNFLNKQKP